MEGGHLVLAPKINPAEDTSTLTLHLAQATLLWVNSPLTVHVY